MRELALLLLCLQMLLPAAVSAVEVIVVKDPFSYSLKYYAMILGVALLGGVASWYGKVRAGHMPMTSISHLAGEMVISAFSGLIVFFFCEWRAFHPLLTAGLTGISGHMGTRGIALLENWATSNYLPPRNNQ